MAPRVSIALPVYNGQNYIRQAIDSALAQSYTDFELIISDNASTDATADICRQYARRDSRIRFHRNTSNIGPARNYNRLVQLSHGRYFQLLTHDDVLDPRYIAESVSLLDSDSSVVMCFPSEMVIDQDSQPLGPDVRTILPMDARSARTRFVAAMGNPIGSPIVLGMIRSDVLRRTLLMGSYDAADLVIVLELALRGKIHHIHKNLLLHREHPHRSVYDYPTLHSHTVWFAPWKEGKITFPAWRIFGECIRAVWRSPLSLAQMTSCYIYLAMWGLSNMPRAMNDFIIAADQISQRLKRRPAPAEPRSNPNESA